MVDTTGYGDNYSVPATRKNGDQQQRRRPYRSGPKRLLDFSLTLLLLPIALPIVFAAAAGIFLCDGGAPFYRQQRVGRNGRIFTIIKLRTMVRDADACLQKYLSDHPEAAAEWEASQKLRDDPRITAAGRVLRKTSLDELPQLWNVLKGDMSLVGPRPIMVTQRDFYSGQAYYRLRPGITGNWQVSARNESEFVSRVHFDTTYDGELSLMTDLKILYRTVGVVIRATGH